VSAVVVRSFCGWLESVLSGGIPKFGVLKVLVLELPCRLRMLPPTPDWVEYLFYVVIPRCLSAVLDCGEGVVVVEWVWVLEHVGRGSEEETFKYWRRVSFVPLAVFGVEFRGRRFIVLFYSPFDEGERVSESNKWYVWVHVMSLELFLEQYGPGGSVAPDLLSHYRMYRVVREGDGVILEPVEKPYYEVWSKS